MPMDEGYGGGRKGSPSRQNHKQPGGGASGKKDGSFGVYPGSGKSDGGIMYDAGAEAACSNPGKNYNEMQGKARVFGTGGAMSGR